MVPAHRQLRYCAQTNRRRSAAIRIIAGAEQRPSRQQETGKIAIQSQLQPLHRWRFVVADGQFQRRLWQVNYGLAIHSVWAHGSVAAEPQLQHPIVLTDTIGGARAQQQTQRLGGGGIHPQRYRRS